MPCLTVIKELIFVMKKSKELFYQIIKNIPNVSEGKMFGASCIKNKKGKVAAILWENTMLFKLNSELIQEALKLDEAHISSHLYASDRLMKSWVTLPFKHANKWPYFTQKAIDIISTLKD